MQRISKNRLWVWIVIGAIIILGGLAYFKAQNRPKGEEVVVEKISRRDIIETVSASGKIFPEIEIKISSDVSGEVVELFVKEGDSVKIGQILARVNPDAYQFAVERGSAGVNVAKSQAGAVKNNIESAKAQRDQSKSQLDNIRKTHERNKQLFKEGIISQSDLEYSETQLKNADANFRAAETAVTSAFKNSESAGYQVKDAEALLREQRTNLGRTTIKAPASGIISKLNIEKGERVVGTSQMSGTEMMRIADLGAMEVQVEVSENDIVRVAVGNEAEIEVDAYLNRRFKGSVTEVANSASNISSLGAANLNADQVTKFIVKVRIDKASYSDLLSNGKKSAFKPGMSATIEINTQEVKSVHSIPIQAVIAYDPDEEKNTKKENENETKPKGNPDEEKVGLDKNPFREAVFVLIGDTVARKDVETGIQDENYIELKSGVSGEETIIIGPYAAISKKLKDGAKVHLKKEDKDTKK
ncbi:MAG: efflux RND transporter periplasmic adaptor subunit [Bacteroidota bacterium]|nr:efflux RND transporter periplasmic adaptor subunit [Bacteroidota bacterium]